MKSTTLSAQYHALCYSGENKTKQKGKCFLWVGLCFDELMIMNGQFLLIKMRERSKKYCYLSRVYFQGVTINYSCNHCQRLNNSYFFPVCHLQNYQQKPCSSHVYEESQAYCHHHCCINCKFLCSSVCFCFSFLRSYRLRFFLSN